MSILKLASNITIILIVAFNIYRYVYVNRFILSNFEHFTSPKIDNIDHIRLIFFHKKIERGKYYDLESYNTETVHFYIFSLKL